MNQVISRVLHGILNPISSGKDETCLWGHESIFFRDMAFGTLDVGGAHGYAGVQGHGNNDPSSGHALIKSSVLRACHGAGTC